MNMETSLLWLKTRFLKRLASNSADNLFIENGDQRIDRKEKKKNVFHPEIFFPGDKGGVLSKLELIGISGIGSG